MMDYTDPVSVIGGEIESETDPRKGCLLNPGQSTTS
jgi:hypothetical protein